MAVTLKQNEHNAQGRAGLKSLARSAGVMLLSATLAACTTVTTVDLESDREINLVQDRELLEPSVKIDLSEPLTLDDVIRIGLINNLDLRVSRFEQEIAKDSSFADKLELLPDLEFNQQYNKDDKLRRDGSFDPDTGQTFAPTTVSTLDNVKTRSLELTWNVLDFGLSYIRSRQSELQQEVLRMRRDRQAQLLALDLTEAFWKAALSEDALDYVRRVERELQAQRAKIEQSVRERRLDAINAKDVEKRLVDLALSVRDLQADIANTRIRLASLMGLKQETRFVLDREPLKPLLAQFPRPDQLGAGVIEDYALSNRPELFERDLGEHIQRDEVRAAMLSMFPSLSFSTGYSYNSNPLAETNEWNSVGYSIGWSLLSLPAQYQRVKAEEGRIGMERAARLQMTVAVITQVHIGLLDYRIAVERFRLYEEAYGLTSELLDMTRERNSAGILSDLSVTQRLLEDMAAKLRRDQAVVDLIVAYRRLLTSAGMDPLYWNQALVELGIEQEQVGPELRQDDVNELLKSMGLDANASGATGKADSYLSQGNVEPRGTAFTSIKRPAYQVEPRRQVTSSAPVAEAVAPGRDGWAVELSLSGKLNDYLVVMTQARENAVQELSAGRDEKVVRNELRRIQKSLMEGRLSGLSAAKARQMCSSLMRKGLRCVIVPPA